MRSEINDLNLTAVSGRMLGEAQYNAEACVLSFDLSTTKQIRGGQKVSRFKVVLFDAAAERWQSVIVAGMRLTVSGELDEVQWANPNGQSPSREVRIVGRFIQVIGGGV